MAGASHFNPLFPYGKRPHGERRRNRYGNFNPLFPYGKRPNRDRKRCVVTGISIHSSHTGRDLPAPIPCRPSISISIHSSHTGRDRSFPPPAARPPHFNPLFPYGKRREQAAPAPAAPVFQSTLPIREETRGRAPAPPPGNFNPLFPYGKRLKPVEQTPEILKFQSTLPIREETRGR